MSTENEIQVLGEERYSYRDCCCFQCAALTQENDNSDCACEMCPVYSKVECNACPKGAWCDVSLNPHDYEHDQDCVCIVCVSIAADQERIAMGQISRESVAAIMKLRDQLRRFAWIPVTESVPDADITVLIHILGFSDPVDVGYTDGEAWYSSNTGCTIAEPVTHWMPLPEPPEAQ